MPKTEKIGYVPILRRKLTHFERHTLPEFLNDDGTYTDLIKSMPTFKARVEPYREWLLIEKEFYVNLQSAYSIEDPVKRDEAIRDLNKRMDAKEQAMLKG